jgi:hypothetical protein
MKSLVYLTAILTSLNLSCSPVNLKEAYHENPSKIERLIKDEPGNKKLLPLEPLAEFCTILYDTNHNNFPDLIVTHIGDNLTFSEYPLMYWFDINEDLELDPQDKLLLDINMDGLNGNETALDCKSENPFFRLPRDKEI